MFEREWESKREEHVEPEAPARHRPREIIQAKLTVGAANDPFEREADRVADSVMRALGRAGAAADVPAGDGLDPMSISRHAGHAGHDHGPPEVGFAGGSISDELSTRIRSSGGGRPLDDGVRRRMEHGFGADFSSVRIHANSALPPTIAADAFTVGRSIHFADGQYDPSNSAGQRLLAHELTHVVQQGGATAQRHVCDSACGHDAATGERTPSVSHELTHAIEHGGAAAVARYSCGSTDDHVQRHSSFEHLMLGNVRPEDLAAVGAWQDAIAQAKPERHGMSKKVRGANSGDDQSEAQVVVDLENNQQLTINKANILHVLKQEMQRLRKWQKTPPTESSARQGNVEGQSIRQIGADPEFGVVTVWLPQGLRCTYGEMNTLADYFGSVEVFRGADKTHVFQLLQSVREETWGFLSDTFTKVKQSLTQAELASDMWDDFDDQLTKTVKKPKFKGAMTPRISGKAGQVELLTGAQGTGAQGATNEYKPSLGRNACHFVPESWHAWAKNHNEARRLAAKSWDAYLKSEQAKDQMDDAPDEAAQGLAQQAFEAHKERATRLANRALVVNGFGDHYLQDSYASGHMINKTQIMQFYIEYIDANNEWDYFKDANWQKVQNIAYNQKLAPPTQYAQNQVAGYQGLAAANATKNIDPQSVETRSVANDGDWEQNFTELGLEVPRSLRREDSLTRQLLSSWRADARDGKDLHTGEEIVALLVEDRFLPDPGNNRQARRRNNREARMAVGDMVLDGVVLVQQASKTGYKDVDVDKRGKQMAEMRDRRAAAATPDEGAGEELRRFLATTYRLRPELVPTGPYVQRTEDERQQEYKAVTYKDYLQFIQSAFLQKSTNALHDTFCAGGLTVYDRAGAEIGTVYGDDAMFNTNSSMGVAHSGTTSQMSRDAILNVINFGGDQGITVQSIVDRFPRKVKTKVYDAQGTVTGEAHTDIEVWHNTNDPGGLKQEAFNSIFPSMAWQPLQKMGPGAAGDLGTFFSAPAPHVPF